MLSVIILNQQCDGVSSLGVKANRQEINVVKTTEAQKDSPIYVVEELEYLLLIPTLGRAKP